MIVGEGLQVDGVGHCVDRGGRADPQHKGQHGHTRETRVPCHLAERVAEVHERPYYDRGRAHDWDSDRGGALAGSGDEWIRADNPVVSTLRARAVTADNWGKPDRNGAGEPICRWCRTPVKPPRRTFCSDACVHEWKIRSSPWYVRREVKKRDKGICRLCGLNVVKAHREGTRTKPPASDRAARKVWRAARPRWEADHIVPVADGGGECGLDNYRLLCRPCHLEVTLQWRAQRILVRKELSRTA